MGHSSCELRRHLDSWTPIRDVVDRCRVWESHADPETRRVSKPGPEPVYPAYAVSEPDKGIDDLRVAAVATPQSTPDQVEIFRRLLASAAAPTPVPTPVPEPPAVERLLQRLVEETMVQQPVPVVASEPAGLETLLRSLLSGHLAPAQQPRPGLECCSVFLLWEGGPQCDSLSHCGRFVSFYASGMEGEEDAGWLYDDFTPDSSGASLSGKRRLIRGEGFATRISSNVRSQDPPGGGGCNTDHRSPERSCCMD